MSFISCVKWVKQGVAKSQPDKVNLNEDELKVLLDTVDNEGISNETTELSQNSSEDEFKFNNYEEEDDTLTANLKGIAVYDKRNKSKNDDSDSEREDDIIKPDDNLLLAGLVDKDESVLLVYVYNDNDGDMYVHHDIILSNTPLCVECLHYKDNTTFGNLCLVGTMHPVIEVWDLDMIGCVEPAFKLGKQKKNSAKNYGHSDAVLDISWNSKLPHILSSGSVDSTVLLWDLDNGKVSTTITQFDDKVQSIAWNSFEPYNLLAGSADNKIRNFDCRVYDEFQTWELESNVEKVSWSKNDPFICFAGTEDGYVHVIDIRNNVPLYNFMAHEKEVTGLVYSDIYSKLLITCSADKMFKIWDISENDPTLINTKNLKLDILQCMDVNPDLPYLACIGGTSLKKNNVKVINMNTYIHTEDNDNHAPINSQSSINSNIPSISPEMFAVPLLERENILGKEKQKKTKSKLKSKKSKEGNIDKYKRKKIRMDNEEE